MSRLVRVGVPTPPGGVYTYLREDSDAVPGEGTRVLVPFGSSRRVGFVLGEAEADPAITPRPLIEILDDPSPFTPELLGFLKEAADYYLVPLADMMRLTVSATSWPNPKARVELTAAGRERWAEAGGETSLPFRRQILPEDDELRLLTALVHRPVQVATLKRKGFEGRFSQLVSRLVAEGVIRLSEPEGEAVAAGEDEELPPVGVALTGEQESAVARLLELLNDPDRRPVLLHGVTASGKTTVYLRLMRRVLDSGRGALLLVPEIALSQALHRVVERELGCEVALLHSAMGDGKRRQTLHRIRSGEVRAVMGPRSSLFAPIAALGLIVVDEEHEPSFKSGQFPRFHGRDMAVLRAHRAGALAVLGSATPSLESYWWTERGKYERVEMNRRVGGRPLPRVALADMRREFRARGHPALISGRLHQELDEALERDEQGLILLNRRGYASQLLCRQCGHALPCSACSQTMVYHRSSRQLVCHLCGRRRLLPRACPECSGDLLELRGAGTERVLSEIEKAFPNAGAVRIDRDRTPRQIERAFQAFAEGKSRILVGTQMIAKGHDFRRVSVVGVLDVDAALSLPDFRGAERTFALLTQVAGRAGRGGTTGTVVVQCWDPSHYALELAATQDYRSFFEREARVRSAQLVPPRTYLALVACQHREESSSARLAQKAADIVRRAGVEVLGPAPAVRARVKGRYRHQLFVRGRSRNVVRGAVAPVVAWGAGVTGDGRVSVDIDPVDLL